MKNDDTRRTETERKNDVEPKEEKKTGYGNKKLEGPDRPST
ncbi:MAG TPA: hypothetical protein VFK44_07095 [Bacillales bacterium]|nr:hypothetical protein [Bacillales bacterium]